ncbi:hypothetical protein VNO77_00582 [Canavalia gladiata]|uniref:Uncharacterized protein n=1 Tax=Canavalia gladiata TaxID=3824 RepID=A0AAN9MU94_CANGL
MCLDLLSVHCYVDVKIIPARYQFNTMTRRGTNLLWGGVGLGDLEFNVYSVDALFFSSSPAEIFYPSITICH